jgi:pimeloyl-ACP methyl ester carboxylesterase
VPEADYDEFGMLAQNAEEVGLVLDRAPDVARRSFTVAPGQAVSAIAWGEAEPELVLLHGGGQNAHTWDTVALSLGRPLLAIDLPGHGHSDRRPDRDYGPWRNAEAVASVMDQAAPRSAGVVGMSLGGVTTIRLGATRPDLVRRAVIVDVTPQVQDPTRTMSQADRGAVALVAGPPVYDSFEAMAEAAVAVFTALWEDVSAITAPVMLVRGGDSKFVTDDHVAQFRSRMPGLRAEVVPDSGHAVQSDQPLALARLIQEFVFG